MKKKPPPPENFDETREQIHRQMLSAVSHDLKTPLATIIGSLEIYSRMDEKLSREKQRSLVISALSEAYRLDNFISNILDMAKLESGMVQVNNEKCDLKALLEDAITRLGPRRERGELRLQRIGSGSTVNTDPMLMGRAVQLLLENALRHTGKHPVVVVDYGIEGSKGVIRIRDNGPGIPSGQEKNIFSKYTRLGDSDTRNAGTGLGLAICQGIMRILSGEVKAENDTAGGAVFLLVFPA
jgi:K+-sensing histidine kinase KdpD